MTLVLGIGLALAACGGPEVGRRSNVPGGGGPEDPLPTELNRNAPPPGFGPEPTPHVVLWCSQPVGPACLAAQAELGQAPSPTLALPLALLERARDLEGDCADPDLAPLMQRVTDAVGAAVGGWTDQTGPFPDPSYAPDLYAGPGCTNAARPGDPPVKIHVADVDGEPRFLVRVWELDEPVSPP